MKTLAYITLIALLVSGCSTSTEITGAWKNPDRPSEISSILVTAMTSKANIRQTIEKDLSDAFRQVGVKAIESFDIMPPTFTQGKEPDREELLQKVRGSNVDAILTVALIDEETENRFVPGNYSYAPMSRFGYYGRFWGYYSNWYPTLYSPGYYEEEKTYFIEINVYDSKTEELLWSGQSESYEPPGLKAFSKEFAQVVLSRLQQDGVIASGSAISKKE